MHVTLFLAHRADLLILVHLDFWKIEVRLIFLLFRIVFFDDNGACFHIVSYLLMGAALMRQVLLTTAFAPSLSTSPALATMLWLCLYSDLP